MLQKKDAVLMARVVLARHLELDSHKITAVPELIEQSRRRTT